MRVGGVERGGNEVKQEEKEKQEEGRREGRGALLFHSLSWVFLIPCDKSGQDN